MIVFGLFFSKCGKKVDQTADKHILTSKKVCWSKYTTIKNVVIYFSRLAYQANRISFNTYYKLMR